MSFHGGLRGLERKPNSTYDGCSVPELADADVEVGGAEALQPVGDSGEEVGMGADSSGQDEDFGVEDCRNSDDRGGDPLCVFV
jgi:hypothetical protein